MHEKMHKLLNAYLDGELHGKTLQELERHLSECSACQMELDELGRVSNLLKSAPAPEFIPAERFVANLSLNLPRHEMRVKSNRSASPAWWIVPVGLTLAWFFIRTAFSLSSLLSVADGAGLLGQASNWIGGQQTAFWFPAAASILTSRSAEAYTTLFLANDINVFGANLVNGFLWQAFIALLYCIWLVLWWFAHHRQGTSKALVSIRS